MCLSLNGNLDKFFTNVNPKENSMKHWWYKARWKEKNPAVALRRAGDLIKNIMHSTLDVLPMLKLGPNRPATQESTTVITTNTQPRVTTRMNL